jgi:hypothetical protein
MLWSQLMYYSYFYLYLRRFLFQLYCYVKSVLASLFACSILVFLAVPSCSCPYQTKETLLPGELSLFFILRAKLPFTALHCTVPCTILPFAMLCHNPRVLYYQYLDLSVHELMEMQKGGGDIRCVKVFYAILNHSQHICK